jgi:putative two-component system response regulator
VPASLWVTRVATILIVDDEGLARSALRVLLEEQGHACLEAPNGAVARRLHGEQAPELVLCDVTLAGESGLDLVRELQRDRVDSAIVMVSGIEDPAVWGIALELGCYGYLTKPVRESELAIAVVNALRRRELELAMRERQRSLEQAVLERTASLRALVREVEDSRAELARVYEETVRRLALAAEYRNVETGRHVERMSSYCALIAERLGLDEGRREDLRLAALLHDVGKIAIPDSILCTPDELSPEEWEQVRRHPELGHRLLSGSGSPVLELAATIALTHHERMNGSGYPRGLQGEDVPLEGRIAAVADVFDALTTARIYQRAHSPEEALDMLEAGRGTLFDVRVLDAFLSAREEVEAIRLGGSVAEVPAGREYHDAAGGLDGLDDV